MSAQEILQKLEGQTIMVVGDVMLDRYLTGSVTRISPEAPVPVVLQQGTEDRLGGAANVALNICALGGIPLLCSVVGEDADGMRLKQEIFPENNINADGIICSATRKTTVKTRVLGNNQQMLRIDQEDTHDLSIPEQELLLEKVQELLDKYPVSVLILQDYNKGVLTANLIAQLITVAHNRGILIAVDPKKANFFAYQGVDLFKPNLKEIRDSAPFTVRPVLESLAEAARFLREKLSNQLTMITLSEKGLYLDDEISQQVYPTIARNVADVSGAGDTVISIAALALAAGLSLDVLALLSNLAGGQVCEFPGVVPVRRDLLLAELDISLRS